MISEANPQVGGSPMARVVAGRVVGPSIKDGTSILAVSSFNQRESMLCWKDAAGLLEGKQPPERLAGWPVQPAAATESSTERRRRRG